MLAAARVSTLTSQVAKRVVRVAGQRQAALSAVRRRENVSTRSIQSVAQTDRVGRNFNARYHS
jgi:N-acetyl-gamma-glutamyl-phosphate reductase/acetylglutamate kinase